MGPVLILTERLGEFDAAAKTLAKRAKRHGLTAPLFRVGTIPCLILKDFTDWDGKRRKYLESYTPVWIEAGEPIRVAGFEFIARLERLGDEHLIHIVPGKEAEVDARFYLAQNKCDHCNTARWRNDTYVVREIATGRQLQVGRNCLRDFLGCDTPEKLAGKFTFAKLAADMASEYGGLGPDGPRTITTETFMTVVACVIRLKGYTSQSMAARLNAEIEDGKRAGPFVTTTRERVRAAIWPAKPTKYDKEEQLWSKLVKAEAGDADREQARQLAEWWAARVPESDFERNVQIILRNSFVAEKHFGYAVAALPVWARATNVTLGPAKEPKAVSEFQGEIGARVKLELDVLNKFGIDTQYGSMTIVKFADAAGNQFSWFTSNSSSCRIGAKVKLAATIKAHNEYKGTKETQLTRCKVEG